MNNCLLKSNFMYLKFFILFSIIIIVIPFTKAALGFDIQVNNGLGSVELEHGSSKDIPVKVINSNNGLNSFCALTCTFKLNDKIYPFNTLDSSGYSDIKTFKITAPNIGRESDSESYQVIVTCEKVSSLCIGDNPTSKPAILIITYQLTQQEKDAKNYLGGVLPTITSSLTQSDSQIKKIEDKINQLKSNFKISSIREEIVKLKGNYESYKSEIQSAKNLYENFYYINSKNSLRLSISSDINNFNNLVLSTDSTLDEIIKKHKEITEKLNLLREKSDSVNKLLDMLKKDKTIIDKVKSLLSKFESGSFNDYNKIDIEQKNLNSELTDLKTSLQSEIDAKIKYGLSTYEFDIDNLCKSYQFCLQKILSKDIENLCINFKNLENKILQESSQRLNSYRKIKEQLKNIEPKIKDTNQLIETINQEITKGSNLNLEECSYNIKKINTNFEKYVYENLESILNETEKSCNSVLNKIKEENSIKIGLLDKFLNLFKNVFKNKLKIDLIKLIAIKEPSTIEISTKSQLFLQNDCNFKISELTMPKVEEVNVVSKDIRGESLGELKQRGELCSIFGESTPCCLDESCRSDPSKYPIIFVHGHAPLSWNTLDYSINSFSDFQERLATSGNYLKGDIILPTSNINSVKGGDWGKINKPIGVRTSYYKGVYDESGRTIGKEEGQSIDVYSQRLSDIVDIVLHHTKKDKVIIVAHSMGGLVSRNYIKNFGGSNKVYKLITIGTPNHGIYGWLIGGLCGVSSSNFPECRDMQSNSTFITNLNAGSEVISPVHILAIIGTCEDNTDIERHITFKDDEVVRDYSARINGAKNVVISGQCVSGIDTFHGDLVKNDQVYNEIINFIKT